MDISELTSFNAEQSVLGSCIIDPDAIEKVLYLSPEDFFSSSHKKMFSEMLKMQEAGEIIELITLGEKIDEDDVPFSYLVEVGKNTSSSKSVVAYGDIVRDMSKKRQLVNMLRETSNRVFDRCDSVVSIAADASQELSKVITDCSVGEVLSIDDLIDITIDEMDKSQKCVRTGLQTGIEEVDERLGFNFMTFGEVTVIGALSKNGKTLLANTITARAKFEGNEVGHIFSIEMTNQAMFNAVVSAKTGVPSNFYCRQDYYLRRFPNMYDTMMGKWGAAAQDLRDSGRLTFDGQKEVDADYICAGMKRQATIARQKGKVLRYVVIDHLHRMNFDIKKHGSMTYAIRDTVRRIKNTASELGIAVLMLAQLNNKAEGENPTSFHILDSSSVRHELQAFIGVRMFRDEGGVYFGIFTDALRFADDETKHYPAYMKLVNGVLTSLPEHEKHWTPKIDK